MALPLTDSVPQPPRPYLRDPRNFRRGDLLVARESWPKDRPQCFCCGLRIIRYCRKVARQAVCVDCWDVAIAAVLS